MAEAKDEGKDAGEEKDAGLSEEEELLMKVASFFVRKRDECAMYGGDADGGLEVIFEDWLDANKAEFMAGVSSDDDGSGHSHALTATHRAYCEHFEKMAEWAIEVEGGDPKVFFAGCERAVAGELNSLQQDPDVAWFMDAVFAALDFDQFVTIMLPKVEGLSKKTAK